MRREIIAAVSLIKCFFAPAQRNVRATLLQKNSALRHCAFIYDRTAARVAAVNLADGNLISARSAHLSSSLAARDRREIPVPFSRMYLLDDLY